jgi:hypothetical protein
MMAFYRAISLPLKMITCLLLCGCGYQLGQGEGLIRNSTLTIPYAIGDLDGSLTTAVVKEAVRSGFFEYRHDGGSLILHVVKIDIEEDNIGFRYDRKKHGSLTKDVIPTEARISMLVEVWVTQAISGCTILGPVRLSASVDYDHDYYSSRDGVNIFSLGQLSDFEAAYDAAQVPLNRAIAEKIIDYISHSW